MLSASAAAKHKHCFSPASAVVRRFERVNMGWRLFLTGHLEIKQSDSSCGAACRRGPLVTAYCKNGFSTLDSRPDTERRSQTNQNAPRQQDRAAVPSGTEHHRAVVPSKGVLWHILIGCANIWDLDRANETFEAIAEKIGLTLDIHSYNALMCAFGKVKKVFEHLVSLGVKLNATTYTLLVDAHLANRDPKAALLVIDEMVDAGFTPSKEMIKKVRRQCSCELDIDSDERLQSLVHQFGYMMGGEGRRELLYNLNYGSNY
ncbi:hypothetical protein KFK09_009192 [Dendrobium nobile]|uniref:Pentatricopeptide repeat-containing protein n=1 Tax=Dendrobium nobile TaxID=94219 RepID=A0A8T3BQA9_DENNO|nr:hypothetical protein KFK09_009192 [Dendrobium nobile]